MIVQNAALPVGTAAADGSEKPPVSCAGLSAWLPIWLPMRLPSCGAEELARALPLEENS